MGKKKKKKNPENLLTKEEAQLIAKTYVHNPTITTPNTISDKDIVSKHLSSVRILMEG